MATRTERTPNIIGTSEESKRVESLKSRRAAIEAHREAREAREASESRSMRIDHHHAWREAMACRVAYLERGERESREDESKRMARHESIGHRMIAMASLDAQTPSRLDVIESAAMGAAIRYIGIDHASIVEATIERMALYVGGWRPIRSERRPMMFAYARQLIENDRHLAGYARRIARSLSMSAATGRGRMPFSLDVERVEGSPNYSPMLSENPRGSWRANNTRGHSYSLVSAIGTPTAGESLTERALSGGGDVRDVLALALAIEEADYSLRDSRIPVFIGHGSPFVPWADVTRDLASLGIEVHATTTTTMVRRALDAARRADDADAIASRHSATIEAIRHAIERRAIESHRERLNAIEAIRHRIASHRLSHRLSSPLTESERGEYLAMLDAIERIEASKRESASLDAIESENVERLARWDAMADAIERRGASRETMARIEARTSAMRFDALASSRARLAFDGAAWRARMADAMA